MRNPNYLKIKRFFDIIFSFSIIILLFPIFLIISLLIKIEDGGSIFFRQQRVGINQKKFYIYKFRSMKSSPNNMSSGSFNPKLETLEEARKKYRTTEIKDNRYTFLGKFMRPIHLDELPQMINIINGSMSLIGPRPDVIAQKYDYEDSDWKKRHKVLPGITGLAQIKKISSEKERTKFDLIYVQNISFLFDIYIFFSTLIKIFKFSSI